LRSSHLTRFVSRYVPHSSLERLCFGAPANQHEEHEGQSVYHFHPGQIFGVVWWRRFPADRQHRAVAIVQALRDDQSGHDLPGIHSAVAVHAIVDQHGPAGQNGTVDLLLDLIEDVKARGQDPAKLPPKYWTKVVHRILLHPHVRTHSLTK
jgi:hypothetical protein